MIGALLAFWLAISGLDQFDEVGPWNGVRRENEGGLTVRSSSNVIHLRGEPELVLIPERSFNFYTLPIPQELPASGQILNAIRQQYWNWERVPRLTSWRQDPARKGWKACLLPAGVSRGGGADIDPRDFVDNLGVGVTEVMQERKYVWTPARLACYFHLGNSQVWFVAYREGFPFKFEGLSHCARLGLRRIARCEGGIRSSSGDRQLLLELPTLRNRAVADLIEAILHNDGLPDDRAQKQDVGHNEKKGQAEIVPFRPRESLGIWTTVMLGAVLIGLGLFLIIAGKTAIKIAGLLLLAVGIYLAWLGFWWGSGDR